MKTKEEIYRALVQRYASESPSILKEVAYNLSLGHVTESSLDARAAAAVAKIKAQQAPVNPLEKTAKAVKAAHLAVCPICKNKMSLVKLLEDREVYYCPDHRINQPLPIGE